jgi:hypothetical protein
VDTATAAGSVLAAIGLAGAAGLNAWLPLVVAAALARLDVVELAAPFDDLATTTGLAVLATLMVLDLIGDKIPAIDHALHAAGTVIAPASGAALFAGQTGLETDLPTVAAAVVGAVLAGTVHLERAALRPASTATTAGAGNPIVSLVEDAVSATLTAVAFLLPILAALAVSPWWPAAHGSSCACAAGSPGHLLDEEHLLVLRERPEVVGDEPLEPVGDRPDVVHRRDDRVAHVLGVLERRALLRVVAVGRLQALQGTDELLDDRLDLGEEALDPAGPQLVEVAHSGGRIIVRAIDAAVSASMFSFVTYCSRKTS